MAHEKRAKNGCPKIQAQICPPKREVDILATFDPALSPTSHVALNTWTNYINTVAETDIDFPVITAQKAA